MIIIRYILKFAWLFVLLLNNTNYIFAALAEDNNDKLIFAAEVIRHGERTPHIDIPNYPVEWEQGIGQLTVKGIQQEYNLGLTLKDIYVNKYNLLSDNYNIKDIYIRSSGYDRTLMSAHAVLNGLFSNNCSERQVFAIHSVPRELDEMMLGFEVHKQEIKDAAKNNRQFGQLLVESSDKIKVWSKVLSSTIADPANIIIYGDALKIRRDHNKLIPKHITNQDIDTLNQLSKRFLALLLYNQQQGIIASKELLKDIKNNIKKVIDKQIAKSEEESNTKDNKNIYNSVKKFILYSGHDVTILSLLSAFGVPLDLSPPTGSHISIQLFEKKLSNKNTSRMVGDSDRYYVKVLFNNKVINIPGCDNNYCSYKKFSEA